MEHFFLRYKGWLQAEIKPQLSAEDERVLSDYADKLPEDLRQDAAKNQQTWLEISSLAEEMDARSIAQAMTTHRPLRRARLRRATVLCSQNSRQSDKPL
jgi:hypothetical protein